MTDFDIGNVVVLKGTNGPTMTVVAKMVVKARKASTEGIAIISPTYGQIVENNHLLGEETDMKDPEIVGVQCGWFCVDDHFHYMIFDTNLLDLAPPAEHQDLRGR